MTPATFRVNTVDDPPGAPTIASPADGTAVAMLSPTLAINNAPDPDSTNLTYNFEIALDPDFTQIVSSIIGVAGGQGATSWTLPVELQENGWYYWRAQADDWLMEGPWSTTSRFLVNTTNDPPSAPVVTAPADGSTVAALATDVVVANGVDPDSSSLLYYFEADTVPTFDSPGIIRSGSVTEGSGTANDPPTTPTLANPSSGAGVSVFSPALSVQNATDPDDDLLTYEFEVSAESSMANPIAQMSGIVETPAMTSWPIPAVLTENQTYYWRARAYDGALTSAWMPIASFMINTANDAPGPAAIISPTDGSSVGTLTPTLEVANAVDPDSDSLFYEFELYAGTTLVTSINGIPGNTSETISWTLATPLADNTVYQWRARAFDGDRYGQWTDMTTFTTHIPVTSIRAEIEFEPRTLNNWSQGRWVKVEIELPHGYPAADIDISSIRLEGTVPAETLPYCINQHEDGDELTIKFRRSDVIAVLPAGEHVPVHVTGNVGSAQFEGVDIIRVIK
ncbi:MAG: hypothetical protein HZC44_04620 [Geobacter sp.]|nr:hypothetical protein [Geobacter sp.]